MSDLSVTSGGGKKINEKKIKTRAPRAGPLTSLFGRLVVGLAHQPAVLHQVVLVARGQLPLAHDAGEAVQVVDEVLRPAHHLRGRDALLAGRALGAESPAERERGRKQTIRSVSVVKSIRDTQVYAV